MNLYEQPDLQIATTTARLIESTFKNSVKKTNVIFYE